MIPTIETARLKLRGFTQDDLPAFAAFYADADASKFVGGPISHDDAWRRMAAIVGHWALRGYGVWAVEEKATGDLCGYCGLWYPPAFPEPECGYALFPAKRGKGFALEAAKRSIDYGFSRVGFQTLISLIVPDNTASRAIAEKLGAEREGTATIRGMTADIWRHPRPKLGGA